MKNTLKTGIALFLIAAFVVFLGAFFKINQTPAGNVLLLTGMVLQLPAAILIVLGLITRSRTVPQR